MDIPKISLMPETSILNTSVSAMSLSIAEQNRRKSEAIELTNFLADIQRANLASQFAEHLLSRMNRFDENLDADHEVGVRLVSFGQSITFHVSDLSYYNPSLIVFIGLTEDGNRVELVQNTSQISFLLIALPKLQPEQPKRKIGFIQENALT